MTNSTPSPVSAPSVPPLSLGETKQKRIEELTFLLSTAQSEVARLKGENAKFKANAPRKLEPFQLVAAKGTVYTLRVLVSAAKAYKSNTWLGKLTLAVESDIPDTADFWDTLDAFLRGGFGGHVWSSPGLIFMQGYSLREVHTGDRLPHAQQIATLHYVAQRLRSSGTVQRRADGAFVISEVKS